MTDSERSQLALEALSVRISRNVCPLCLENIKGGEDHDSDCRLWEIEQQVPDIELVKPDKSPYS